MKIVSGHQPVYLPWLGLIHKASLADVFVYMDDVQYLERDWNNRNKVKTPQGGEKWLTVPVDLAASSSKLLKDIRIKAENLPEPKRWSSVHWMTLQSCYGKSPFFKDYKDFFAWLYMEKKWELLSDLNLAMLKQVLEWFSIKTEIVIASQQNFTAQKSDLVLEHGVRFGANIVVTGALGKNYINEASFKEKGIKVLYQEYKHPEYQQRFGAFLPRLAFVDLLFNHGPASREIALSGNWTREEICQLASA